MISPGEKIVESRHCKHCNTSYDITDVDLKFYETMGVSSPTWCPECRILRKMAWCNEGVLYSNICLSCNKNLVSFISQNDERKVYCLQCYFGDIFDPLAYGVDYDSSKSFFEQLHHIQQKIPHLYAAVDSQIENSDFMHQAGHAKNCYLLFHASYNEDCYYGYGIKKCKNCLDNHYCHESQWCFECVDVRKCHTLSWCQDCENCTNSSFLRNCLGCSDCFLCCGLVNKKFHILNQEYSPDGYKKKVLEFNTGSRKMVAFAHKKLTELASRCYFKNVTTLMTENCAGDHLLTSKNASNCFDCSDIEDCKNCYQIQLGLKNSHDIYQYGINSNWMYESTMVGYNMSNNAFLYNCDSNCHDLMYCMNITSSTDSFGCVGLKKHQYCILNKQYSSEEYALLRSKIIEKMKSDGEWGEFFPIKYSESCYNETIAQQWFPKTKEEVLSLGWRWQDNLPGTYGKETITELPDDVRDTKPNISEGICRCETCNKNYRIIPQELQYLYKNNLPLPRQCFDCRGQRRFNKRNKRTMRDAPCHECHKMIPTTYPEDFQGKICCEECYRKIVY